MDLRKVLFIGGDPNNLASVHIRCLDIAKRLGCDYIAGEQIVENISNRYSTFVCVKPQLFPYEHGLSMLARKGIIVWDIIDSLPPREDVALYLCSTKAAQVLFASFGQVEVIPHHHSNISGISNAPELRRPAWIGSVHWLPCFPKMQFDFYNVRGMCRENVAEAHRKIGIGLNFRARRAGIFPAHCRKILSDFHVAINSGIKLINCIGFGIPSISADEPAYHEIGMDCTICCDLWDSAHWVNILQNDQDLYQKLRKNCLRKQTKYHLDTIAEKYRKLLRSL